MSRTQNPERLSLLPTQVSNLPPLCIASIAECLATFIFVYVGCGSVVNGTNDTVGVALSFGLSIAVLVYSIGHYSGGHINPIVSISMFIYGKIDFKCCVSFIAAQVIGAILGAAALSLTTMEALPIGNAVNAVNPSISLTGAFIMEFILSFLLVFVISETALNEKTAAGNNAPLAIGLAVFMAHISAIPFTGCGINPARSIGPAIVSGNMDNLWLYIIAPIIGGSAAALMGKHVFKINKDSAN